MPVQGRSDSPGVADLKKILLHRSKHTLLNASTKENYVECSFVLEYDMKSAYKE